MYPKLQISLKGIENNSRVVSELCKNQGIAITGVVKSSNSYEESYIPIAKAMKKGGIESLGD